MILYFLRHEIAVEREDWADDDALRPLTDAGKQRVELVGKAMAHLQLESVPILTSPLLRARQTAEIVARRLRAVHRIEQEPLLAPGFGPRQLSAIVRARANERGLLLVGHEPDFSYTIGQLIGGAHVVCKKGGLVRVDLSQQQPLQGTLAWLVPPKVFAAMR